MEDIFEQLKPFWKILAINFTKDSPSNRKIVKFYFTYGFWLYFISGFLFSLLSFPLFKNDADFEVTLLKCSLGMMALICVVSYLVIYIKRFKIFELQDLVLKIQKASNMRMIELGLNKKLQKVKMFQIVLKRYVFFGFICFTGKSFFDFFLHGKENIFNFPYNLPFDATQSAIFPLIYAWIWIPQASLGLFYVAYFQMLSTFVVILGIQFDIIRYDLKDWRNKDCNRSELIKLIDRHGHLFMIAKKLEEIYSTSFFANFVLSSFVMCLSAFNIIVTSHMGTFIISTLVFTGALFLIGLQCIFGQILKDASENVANSIYDIGWENIKNNDTKKYLAIILMRAQKPVTLTILKFSQVSYEQFGAVSNFN